MNKKLIRKMQTASGGPINYKRWDDAKITSYTIPFIKEKAIKLTNAGRATGAVLSTNLLDSLVDNAIRAGVPIRTAIGLATKESTLGNPTDDRSAWNISSKIRKLFNGVYPGTVQHINNGINLVNGINLINYHKGNINHEMFNGAQGKSIIQEGLEFYKVHPDKYNPGLKGYQKAVDSRGEEVMNSPEVLKWYRKWERSKAQIFKPEPYKINTNIQNTAQEFVSRNKQGGKMNIIEFLKNGSGIHIKKKNRGKFTSYCGGKVTDECIRKAKTSGNPTLVKRATFAANARKWKHEKGGIFKAQEGTNTGQWILLIGNVIAQGYNTYKLNLYFNLLVESIKSKNEADKTKYRALMYLNFLKSFNMSPEIDNDGNIINKSDLVARNEAYKYASSVPYDDSLMLQQLANIELQKAESLNNFISELGNSAINMIASNALNKNGVPSSMIGRLVKNGTSSTISDDRTLSSIGFKSNVFDSNNMKIGEMKKIVTEV